MQTVRTPFDVTLAPAHPQKCCDSPTNLTGSYGLHDDECFRKNQIYRNNGQVCQKIMRGCVCPTTVAQRKRIDDFCGTNQNYNSGLRMISTYGANHGPSATTGFYHNGAYWSIS